MFLWCLIINLFLIPHSISCYSLTENQIKEDIKFLSQTNDAIKPSRLRILLLADLKKALKPIPEINCTTDAELKVTPNCTCIDYSCERSINHGKRSRIQRSCEDFCCRRSSIVKKSSNLDSFYGNKRKYDGCADEYMEPHESTTPVKLPGIVQIYTAKAKYPICLGSLIHPRIVMTTLVCATMQMNDRFTIKIRETIDKYQYRYQVRNVTKKIIPDNYPELFEKFGFNVALLVLNKEIELNNEIRTSCLSKMPYKYYADEDGLRPPKCYVDALENKNGRLIEKRERVTIYSPEQCQYLYKKQNRPMMFFPKSNLCAGRLDGQDIEISLNGAPLVCLTDSKMGYRHYEQYGLLSWSTAINQSPHLFANVNNFKNWIEKNIKILNL